ncbi:MAG: NUDIX domain-containing protein [Sedimentibacter saalensis]|jgi:8-oxo-dGTP diphosphatase|nr:NUDIX domain-containing protein [Sedimentibacter saalensis]MEA5093871.1 NUDIX domain-containing protein [Sedimentibacter saalensis]
MKFRNIATAFLMNNDDVLLMERSETNKRMPGFWYGVGGHVEPEEINDPYSAVIREIYEETGLKDYNVENLKLKYMLLRREKDETVINYVYFGRTNTKMVLQNDEGSLHWIPKQEAMNRKFIDVLKLALEHYFEDEKNDEVMVGVMQNEKSTGIKWSTLMNMEQ